MEKAAISDPEVHAALLKVGGGYPPITEAGQQIIA